MKKSIIKNLQYQIKFIENSTKTEIDKEVWLEKFILYAEISPLCDNRFEAIKGLNFGHIMTEEFFLFKMRYIKGITSKMRISFKARQFEIKRIINVAERNKFLNIIGLEIYVS